MQEPCLGKIMEIIEEIARLPRQGMSGCTKVRQAEPGSCQPQQQRLAATGLAAKRGTASGSRHRSGSRRAVRLASDFYFELYVKLTYNEQMQVLLARRPKKA